MTDESLQAFWEWLGYTTEDRLPENMGKVRQIMEISSYPRDLPRASWIRKMSVAMELLAGGN